LAFYVGECIGADVMLQEKKGGPRDSADIRGGKGRVGKKKYSEIE
jgi:hypothetical protein